MHSVMLGSGPKRSASQHGHVLQHVLAFGRVAAHLVMSAAGGGPSSSDSSASGLEGRGITGLAPGMCTSCEEVRAQGSSARE